jgi:hypothetical protein
MTLPTVADFAKGKLHLNNLKDIVSGSETVTTPEGTIHKSVKQHLNSIDDQAAILLADKKTSFDQAIRSAGGAPINGGVWASGQTFESYNEFMIYGGVAYKPLSTTALPYGLTGSEPDLSYVQPYHEDTKYDVSSIDDLADCIDIYGKSFSAKLVDGLKIFISDIFRHGDWVLRYGDYSHEVSKDTFRGLFCAISGEDGSTRCFVRTVKSYITPLIFGGKSSQHFKAAIECNFGYKVVIPKHVIVSYDWKTYGSALVTDDLQLKIDGEIKIVGIGNPMSLDDEKNRYVMMNRAPSRIDVKIYGSGKFTSDYESCVGLFGSFDGMLNDYEFYGIKISECGNNFGITATNTQAGDNSYSANSVNILHLKVRKCLTGPRIGSAPLNFNISLNKFKSMTLANPQTETDRGWGSAYCGRTIRVTGFYPGATEPDGRNDLEGGIISNNIIDGATYGIECFNGYTSIVDIQEHAKRVVISGNSVKALYGIGSNGNGETLANTNTVEALVLDEDQFMAYEGYKLLASSTADSSPCILLEFAPGSGSAVGNVLKGNYKFGAETDYANAITGLKLGGVDSINEDYTSEILAEANMISGCYLGVSLDAAEKITQKGGSITKCAIPLKRFKTSWVPQSGKHQIISISGVDIEITPRDELSNTTPISLSGDTLLAAIINFKSNNLINADDSYPLYNTLVHVLEAGTVFNVDGNTFRGGAKACITAAAGVKTRSAANTFDKSAPSSSAFIIERGDGTEFESVNDVIPKGSCGFLTKFEGTIGNNEYFKVVNPSLDTSYYDRAVFSANNTDLIPDVPVMSGYRSLIPTSGFHSVGESILFSDPVSLGALGATCIARGNPATWKKFGALM